VQGPFLPSEVKEHLRRLRASQNANYPLLAVGALCHTVTVCRGYTILKCCHVPDKVSKLTECQWNGWGVGRGVGWRIGDLVHVDRVSMNTTAS